MKFVQIIFIAFFSTPLFGQDCISLDNLSMDYLGINPSWIKKNKIVKVVEREYLPPSFEKLHLVNVLVYNEEGYVLKKINGIPYPQSEEPNENDFTSVKIYEYEIVDSFLHQKEMVVRNFDENGRLSRPDTLQQVSNGYYNIYGKSYQTSFRDTLAEYKYNGDNQISKIISHKPIESIIDIKYESKKVKRVERNFNTEYTLPFSSNQIIDYSYNASKLIDDATSSQGWRFKYFYDHSNAIIRKELYMNNMLLGVYTYEYRK